MAIIHHLKLNLQVKLTNLLSELKLFNLNSSLFYVLVCYVLEIAEYF
jgi:hypothetical protein